MSNTFLIDLTKNQKQISYLDMSISTIDELEQAVFSPKPLTSLTKVENISDEFFIGSYGEDIIQKKLEKIAKKFNKWGYNVPKLTVIETFISNITKKNVFGEYEIVGKKEQKKVRIEGEIPHIDGYEFVAKIEHTSDGNIIHHVPTNNTKTIPEKYRTYDQMCDVCHQNRERYNTFILRITKNNPIEFPDKLCGDFIMVGSGCLKKFLPEKNVQELIAYAKLIDEIRNIKQESLSKYGDDEDFWDSNSNRTSSQFKYHFPKDTILLYCCYAYVINNYNFVSCSESRLSDKISTSSMAVDMILDRHNSSNSNKILINNPEIRINGTQIFNDLTLWLKTKSWDEDVKKSPDLSDFFHNLDVINKSDSVNLKNSGYVAQLLNSYLRFKKEQERIEQIGNKSYVGTVGSEITISLQFRKNTFFPRNNNKPYDIWKYLFIDRDGNDIAWWTSKKLEFEQYKWYEMTTTIKSHEISSYTNTPVTYITMKRGKKQSIKLIS